MEIWRFEAHQQSEPVIGSQFFRNQESIGYKFQYDYEKFVYQGWEKGKGDVLITDDIKAGLILAIYNSNVRRPSGYLGQFTFDVSPCEEDAPRGMLNQVYRDMAKSKGFEKAEAWLGGASLINEPSIGTSKQAETKTNNIISYRRQKIVEQLREFGITNIKEGWLDENEEIDALTFDTATGHVHYLVVSNYNLENESDQ